MANVHANFEQLLHIVAKQFGIPPEAALFIKLLIAVSADKRSLKFDITDDDLMIFARKSIFTKQSASSGSTLQRYRKPLEKYLMRSGAKGFVHIEQSEHTAQGGYTTYDISGIATLIDRTHELIFITDLIHNPNTLEKMEIALMEFAKDLEPARLTKRESSQARETHAILNS